MPVEIVRGHVGRENAWSVGQEGGFIAYLRGTIGDAPAPSEVVVFGDARTFEDSYGLAEVFLQAYGKKGDDVPNYSESTTITNS